MKPYGPPCPWHELHDLQVDCPTVRHKPCPAWTHTMRNARGCLLLERYHAKAAPLPRERPSTAPEAGGSAPSADAERQDARQVLHNTWAEQYVAERQGAQERCSAPACEAPVTHHDPGYGLPWCYWHYGVGDLWIDAVRRLANTHPRRTP